MRFTSTTLRFIGCGAALLCAAIAAEPAAAQAKKTPAKIGVPAGVPAPVAPSAPVAPPAVAYLDLSTNADAKIKLNGKDQGIIKVGETKKISVPKTGANFLKATSVSNEADFVGIDLTFVEKVDQTLALDLKKVIDEREKAENAEKAWKAAAAKAEEAKASLSKRNADIAAAAPKVIADDKAKLVKAFVKADAPEFLLVEGGSFALGCKEGECNPDEAPNPTVYLTSFYMSRYEVTQDQWMAIMGGKNPSEKPCGDCPVTNVSYDDAVKFLGKLNLKTKMNYKLPTEAQWQYAAKGGNATKGTKYAGSNELEEVAWYDKNSSDKPHPVGKKKPNEIGLYDMSGNVWEWCQDWYGPYPAEEKVEYAGLPTGTARVYTGGSFHTGTKGCRTTHRNSAAPATTFNYVGFRLVRLP
ncbi:MAG: formylglycine-generating enzyme family protein [Bacteroidota bacterium]